MRSVSVSEMGAKLDPSRDGLVEEDEDVDLDESRESTGARSSFTASLVALTPAAVLFEKATLAGG